VASVSVSFVDLGCCKRSRRSEMVERAMDLSDSGILSGPGTRKRGRGGRCLKLA